MEKSTVLKKGISYVLDARKISPQKTSFSLEATKEECQALAEWYEIPAVLSVKADITAFSEGSVITVEGKLSIITRRECVITAEEFTQSATGDFTVLFSTSPIKEQQKPDIDLDEEPIEFLPRGQIYFKDIITEQFGLLLDPFPKNTDEPFEYREESAESGKENPFSVLKHLTKD